ncbi:hypothetical protein BaRGS_00009732 [Batillaria attramentaria]|uniref:Transporter n=1 Tax=Batillaria attramentaria TaxID=370345 RepID=A0ABD0LHM6_9CAEN
MATFSPTANGDHIVHLMPDDNGVAKVDDDRTDDGKDEARHEGRFTWTSKREYILAAVGYCVGLGNIWRFPYLCQRNGGGAFLIPFLLALVVCGLPLFLLEAAIGQFMGRSSVHIWSVCPLFKGCGIGSNLVSLLCFWYYNTIMAWALYYLVSSCQSVLPWSRCDGWWNTADCTDLNLDGDASQLSGNVSLAGYNGSSIGAAPYDVSTLGTLFLGNTTSLPVNGTKSVSAAEEFWQHNVLQVSSGFEEPGHVVWYLVVTLAVTLLVEFLALIKGVKSTGKLTVAETILTTLCDLFPRFLHRYRIPFTAVFCALFLPLGLTCITQGGVYVFQLMDWFIATFIPLICFIECIAIAWIYGADYFGEDIQMMIGRKPPMIFKLLWCFITPFCLLVSPLQEPRRKTLTICTWVRYTTPAYGDYEYGAGGVAFGWCVAILTFLPAPVLVVYQLYKSEGTLLQRLRRTTRPAADWGPANADKRVLYRKEMLHRQPRSGCLDVIRR